MSTPLPSPTVPPVQVELLTAPTLTFAMEQSGVPLVRDVLLSNTGATTFGASVLELQLLPELGDAVRVLVPALPAGETTSLGMIDLRSPAGRLRSITETERAQLRWTLRQDAALLAEGVRDVEVLPYNHWPGVRAPLGLLATFVTPNHPVIPELLKDVRALLEHALGDGSLSGYQRRNPSHVRAQVAAVYEALQALRLGYAEVPPSFEEQGQKVRLPDQLLREGMGCCLDLSLLFASVLEAMGLHPLLLLVHGHALPAVWLIDERFPEGLVEDASRVRNLVALGHVLPFDASTCVNASRPTLEQAVAVGLVHLSADERFIAALDVRVLRFDRYRPLPLRTVESPPPAPEATAEPAQARIRAILTDAASAPPLPEDKPASAQVVSRFGKWKEKLLDLTLRNKLLNFRLDTRGALPLHMPDLAGFEDSFSSGDVYEVSPAAEEDRRDQRAAKFQQARSTEAELVERRLQDLSRSILHSPLREGELLSRARFLDLTTRTDLEEGGAHTLYLSIGLLRWLAEGDPTPRLAPLVLYPVALRLDRDRQRLRLVRLPDEPVGNVTLAEKLKRDYGLDASVLSSLDSDDKGLDVKGLVRAMRLAIQSRPGWEVLEEAHVGHFTFTKFLMWKDLEDNESVLLSNPLVRHIAATGTSAPPVNGQEFHPERIDTEVPAADLPCVVNADSTQMAAIASALSGRSFVLQGPPGTGKSQTITNLIAAALVRGKSVLFVSEKMAALEVVHRRLKDVGLDDFCLELHSRKSNKKEVLASFGRAYERERRTAPPPWRARSEELTTRRETLNAYVQALHRRWPLGLSVYEATSQLLVLRDAPEVQLSLPPAHEYSEASWREARAEVEGLASHLRAVRALGEHPWGAVRGLTWTSALEEQLLLSLGEVSSALGEVKKVATPLAAALGVDVGLSTHALRSLAQLGEVLASGPLPAAALLEEAWPELARQTQAHALALREQSARESLLATRWNPELFSLELPALHARFLKWAHGFFLFALLFLWQARKQLSTLARRELPGNPQIEKDLAAALQVVESRPTLATQAQSLASALSGVPREDIDRPDALDAIGQRALQTRELRDALGVRRPHLPADARARELLSTQSRMLRSTLDRLSRAEEALATLLQVRVWEPFTSPHHRDSLQRQVDAWKVGLRGFRAWCLYQAQVSKLRALGQGVFVDAVDGQGLAPDQLVRAFDRAVLTSWTRAIQDTEPALRDFEARAHSDRIARFQGLDGEHVGLSRQHVISTLEQKLPSAAIAVSDKSESGILARELRKKARQMALRKLLSSIPQLSRRLKPCFLMSPLSVAQYLPADGRRFDLLVFDEASQIGTHDAIGAIARADQVIVVGDSKQLPPTSFFSRGEDPDAVPDENDIVELESILEEALAKQLPQQMLGWHYRSRHDSLIDFSNRQYYDGRLHVFPAARARVEDLGIKWHPVPDGVYQSRTAGKTAAINPREAQTLVGELVEALRRYTPQERTFGVVTFSAVQQQLILELLEAERAAHPEIEPHFSSAEPVFVKNLENVQGDERDEIFFSICYAKDAVGKLRMHFGPLSRAGGERRLNVAVTRARCCLRVFSTLTHDQIDLSRTASVGARHLREFLRKAAESGSALALATERRSEGALEADVATALRARGHTVHADVGSGAYRVDLAVVHPHRPGEYVLGVECDGSNYRSAASARDRDRLRGEVLQGLGWRLHRVWSSAWAQEREEQLRALETAIQHSLENQSRPPSEPRLKPASMPPSDTLARAASAEAPSALKPEDTQGVRPYVPAKLSVVKDGMDFFAPAATERIREQIQVVLAQEAPLHEELLARRLLDAWDLKKLTLKVRQRIEEQTEELNRRGAALVRGSILWSGMSGHVSYREFRGEHPERDISMLPAEEIANAAASVLARGFSLERDDLLRETGRLFGMQRLTRTALSSLQEGLDVLVSQGRCAVENERVVWKG